MIVKSLVVGCCLLHILQRVSTTNATQTRLYQVVIPSWSISGVSWSDICDISNLLTLIWNHISLAFKNCLSALCIRNKISVLVCFLAFSINHILQELVEVRLLLHWSIILRSVRICCIISLCFLSSFTFSSIYNFIMICIIARILILQRLLCIGEFLSSRSDCIMSSLSFLSCLSCCSICFIISLFRLICFALELLYIRIFVCRFMLFQTIYFVSFFILLFCIFFYLLLCFFLFFLFFSCCIRKPICFFLSLLFICLSSLKFIIEGI